MIEQGDTTFINDVCNDLCYIKNNLFCHPEERSVHVMKKKIIAFLSMGYGCATADFH